MLIIFSILPFISTMLGGFAAIRLRHRLHPIMGFAAGVLVATALIDLLPEAAELMDEDAAWLSVGTAAVIGYVLFSALEAFVHRQAWEHQHPPLQDPLAAHAHPGESEREAVALGLIGPLGLIFHSTLDGLEIGLGFRASTELGLIVAMAVLAHGFADGMNVVTLTRAGGRGMRSAAVLLALDAVAPAFGMVLSNVVELSNAALGMLLAIFAGVFLAIGAGHLLPEAQHRQPGTAVSVVLLAAAGAIVVLGVRTALG